MFLDKYFEIHDAKSKIDPLLNWSLKQALKHQKMDKLYGEICKAIPDISNQYSNPDGMNCMDEKSPDYAAFYTFKVRAQHCFQVLYSIRMIQKFCGKNAINIADVGDSSGNHIKYLQALQSAYGYNIKDAFSVNLDPVAIEKINKNGGKAILHRAELLHEIDLKCDVMLSFEMLEHLASPVDFLYKLSISLIRGSVFLYFSG
jgi:2-polyprenyl-3-methyl-5-hydroxy-6-metoxy-1,4-benzoquinol methylase